MSFQILFIITKNSVYFFILEKKIYSPEAGGHWKFSLPVTEGGKFSHLSPFVVSLSIRLQQVQVVPAEGQPLLTPLSNQTFVYSPLASLDGVVTILRFLQATRYLQQEHPRLILYPKPHFLTWGLWLQSETFKSQTPVAASCVILPWLCLNPRSNNWSKTGCYRILPCIVHSHGQYPHFWTKLSEKKILSL